MSNLIQKVQNKPYAYRVRLVWLLVIVSMLIIMSLWLVAFKKNLSQATNQTKQQLATGQISGPIKDLKNTASQIKTQTPSLLTAIRESINNLIQLIKK